MMSIHQIVAECDCTSPTMCRQAGRCLAKQHGPKNATNVAYEDLRIILEMAYDQSARGKGVERHANQLPWRDQPINTITQSVGLGFPAGQAVKKVTESLGMVKRNEYLAARREVLGAIVYLAALYHNIGE